MDGKDYHYGQIKNVLLKQKFVSLERSVSTLFSKNSTSVALLASKIWFTFSDAKRFQIDLLQISDYFKVLWHRGNKQSLLCVKSVKAVTAVNDHKDLKARLDQFLSVWKQLLLVTLG